MNNAKNFLGMVGGFSVINIFRALFPFLLLPILTSKLSIADFGKLSIADTTILILTPLLLFNANGFLSSRYYKYSTGQIATLNSNALLLIVMSFLCAQLISIYFGSNLHGIVNIKLEFIYLLPAFVFFRMLNVYTGSNWQVRHDITSYGFHSIGTTVADFALVIFFIYIFNMGWVGKLLGSHFALAFLSGISIWRLKKCGLINWKFSKQEILEILKFGLPLVPHSLGGLSLALSVRYILSNKIGLESVGLYTVAYQMASILLLIGTSINQAWSVTLFKLLGDYSKANKYKIRKIMTIIFMLITLSFAVLISLENTLFDILSSEKFHGAKKYYSPLLISSYLQSIYFLFVNFDFYEERVTAIGLTTISIALINFIIAVALTEKYGLTGAVYATVISMGLYLLVVVTRVALFNDSFRKVWQR